MSIAFWELSNGFCKASINTFIADEIYGFLIVSPIKLKAYEAFYLIVGWALLRHPDNVGTIIGKDVWSCLAEQFAMIPKIQI